MTDMQWLLGTVGLLAIEGSYVPQIARLYRQKRADDVSLFFPGLNLTGRLSALAYSASRGEHVFAFGLLVGILLRAILLLQVLWYRRHTRLPRLTIIQTERPVRGVTTVPGISAVSGTP